MGRLRSHWRRRRHQDRIAQAAGMLPELTARMQAHGQFADAHLWVVQKQLASINDVSVVAVGAKGGAPVALLKIAHSPSARESLDKHASVLERLNMDPRLKDWSVHLPKILATGQAEEPACLIESRLPGATASQFAASPHPRKLMQHAAVEAIGVLHRITAQEVTLDEAWLKQWVGEPARRIAAHMAGDVDAAFLARSLEQLVEEINARLSGRQAIVSWTHGDYSLENILLDKDGRHVIGILDWDRAAPNGLPRIDIVLLILSSLMQVRNRELGDIVSELLAKNTWGLDAAALMEKVEADTRAGDFGLEVLVLLCWLNHVDANLQKSDRYTGSRIWKAKNIASVLHQLPEGIGKESSKKGQAPADGAGAA
jgi:aminoglycoside phosphotransferase